MPNFSAENYAFWCTHPLPPVICLKKQTSPPSRMPVNLFSLVGVTFRAGSAADALCGGGCAFCAGARGTCLSGARKPRNARDSGFLHRPWRRVNALPHGCAFLAAMQSAGRPAAVQPLSPLLRDAARTARRGSRNGFLRASARSALRTPSRRHRHPRPS